MFQGQTTLVSGPQVRACLLDSVGTMYVGVDVLCNGRMLQANVMDDVLEILRLSCSRTHHTAAVRIITEN